MNTEPNQPVTQASPFPVYGNGDCPHCGGKLIGDGFKTVIRCENAAESDYEFSEPDAQPVFCDPPTPLTDAEASRKSRPMICTSCFARPMQRAGVTMFGWGLFAEIRATTR